MEVTQAFAEYFGDTILEMLDTETSVIYGLSADLRLALLNEAWFDYARENGAPSEFFETYGLGGCYLNAVPDVLQEFFKSHLCSSIEHRRPWTFNYQAPTPSTYQEIRMHVLPMARELGCVITNAPIVERPHERKPNEGPTVEEIQATYVGDRGSVMMCVHCRRTKRAGSEESWDWVPEFVQDPPEAISQDICPSCLAYFSAQAEVA